MLLVTTLVSRYTRKRKRYTLLFIHVADAVFRVLR